MCYGWASHMLNVICIKLEMNGLHPVLCFFYGIPLVEHAISKPNAIGSNA
jgi:hypothetical protein